MNSIDNEFINEGKVKIKSDKSVFYNKAQEFNRDLSVLAVQTYLKNEFWKLSKKSYIKDKITILDALSASGLRSIRYSIECKQCSLPIEIWANDLSESAVQTIECNIDLNDAYNVIVTNDDASMLMYKKKALNEYISIIDLDPYGSPIPFLDSAIRTIADGGLFMVTSTDMAVLCGNQEGACYAKYGSYPIKAKFCHEMALRILITSVNAHANRYGRYVVPLLSLSIDFYVRIFFQVFTSKNEAQNSISKLSYVFQCRGCESFYFQPLCETKKVNHLIPANILYDKNCKLCDMSLKIGGPIWTEPIHQTSFVDLMQNELAANDYFGTFKRMKGMLQLIKEELTDCPLYYQLDRLCCLANCKMPTMKLFFSIIINAGYKVSLSHALKNSIKTNAPNEFIWSIIQYLFNTNESKCDSCISTILQKNFDYKINTTLIDEEPLSKSLNLLRYQVNPENWGPKCRPSNNVPNKQKRNQNKNVNKQNNHKKIKTEL